MEESNKTQKNEVWEQIYQVVSKIPIKDIDGDSVDAPSVATELEELFLNTRREELIAFANYCEREWNCTEVPTDVIDEYLKS